MEGRNKGEGYSDLGTSDNEENINLYLIKEKQNYFNSRKKYFDIFLISSIIVLFFIILLLRPKNTNISVSEKDKKDNINNNKKEENINKKNSHNNKKEENINKENSYNNKKEEEKNIKKDNTNNDNKIDKEKDTKQEEEKNIKKEDTNNKNKEPEINIIKEEQKSNNLNDYYNNRFKNLKSQLLDKNKALDSGIPYVKTCLDGKLINNHTLYKIDKPLITVVIPCYFCSPYIKKAVRSVQNQNFMDITINIVIDGSDENTLKVLKELTEEDSRIELIFNEKRMGILYSRSIGVLKSKTKYVLTLDQDDLFFDSDVFSYLYVIAENEDFDMIVFQAFDTKDFLNRRSYVDNLNNKGRVHNSKVYQPELSCHTLIVKGKKNFEGNDFFIWGKFFKAPVYKSAINVLGKDRYSVLMEWEEDFIMTFLIVNVANSYLFVKKYGLVHLVHGGTPTSTLSWARKTHYRLIKVDLFFDFAKKECIHAPVIELIDMKKAFGNQIADETKVYLKRLIKKIFALDIIEEKYKQQIKNLYVNFIPDIANFI